MFCVKDRSFDLQKPTGLMLHKTINIRVNIENCGIIIVQQTAHGAYQTVVILALLEQRFFL